MFHGLTNDFLYSAVKVETIFTDGVNTKQGYGTAFFVKNKNDQVCLVTNRHVLDLNYRSKTNKYLSFKIDKIVVRLKALINGKPDNEKTFLIINKDVIKYPDNYNNDVGTIINVQALNIDPYHLKDISIDYWIPYNLIAKTDDFENKLSICDFLAFPGFPDWHDKKSNRPILRTGTIASDPRYNYSNTENNVEGDCIAYEAFSYSGSSGSPIFAIQKGVKAGPGLIFPGFRDLLMIGINAGHFETENKLHSGISYFYKSPVIIDLIDN